MRTELTFEIGRQPNDLTCGPTCLQAIYKYWGDMLPLDQVIAEIPQLEQGGTLDVFLAIHALRRGYRAIIYTYNLTVFDPSWFTGGCNASFLTDKLQRQLELKPNAKLEIATNAYIEFLALGGELRYDLLRAALLRRPLKRGCPILTGLSSTYLYDGPREIPENCQNDDLRGEPAGHFVVVCGYDQGEKKVSVADPWQGNPMSETRYYQVSLERVIGAIFLGVMTYDANILLIEPERKKT